MKLQDKQLATIIPGSIGVNVIDGDLSYAMREFKKQIKDTEVIQNLYNNKYYTKPSVSKRKMLDNAKFLQKNKSDKEKRKWTKFN